MAASPLAPGSHFFEADGLRLHYRVQGNGPVAVFQSLGWGLSGAYLWNGLGPHIEKERTVVYVEPRGNGDSEKPSDSSTLTAKVMVGDLEKLRSHLGLDVFPILMGHSHAGAIALGYAEQYPERVSKLLLLAPQIMDAPSGHMKRWMDIRKDNPDYAACLARMGKVFSSGGSTTDAEFLEDLLVMFDWHFADVKKTHLLRKDLVGVEHPATATSFQTNRNDSKDENKLPHIAEAGKVQAKTLLIWGEQDAACSHGDGRAVVDVMKDARLVVIPSGGHFTWYETPEPFWQEVLPFLQD